MPLIALTNLEGDEEHMTKRRTKKTNYQKKQGFDSKIFIITTILIVLGIVGFVLYNKNKAQEPEIYVVEMKDFSPGKAYSDIKECYKYKKDSLEFATCIRMKGGMKIKVDK